MSRRFQAIRRNPERAPATSDAAASIQCPRQLLLRQQQLARWVTLWSPPPWWRRSDWRRRVGQRCPPALVADWPDSRKQRYHEFISLIICPFLCRRPLQASRVAQHPRSYPFFGWFAAAGPFAGDPTTGYTRADPAPHISTGSPNRLRMRLDTVAEGRSHIHEVENAPFCRMLRRGRSMYASMYAGEAALRRTPI